jgi:PAS domain S-box-containing protein
MSVEVGSGSLKHFEPILDVLATPAIALEPGTGRVLHANPAATALTGGALPAHDVFARAVQGERLEGVPVEWASGAGRRSLLVSAAPVAGAVLVTLEDVTELDRARRRATLIAETGTYLGGSLDPAEVVRAVADAAVPLYADWAFVELVRPDGSIVREAWAMADPSKAALATEYDRLYPLDPASEVGSPRVIRTGEPELIPEIPDEFLVLAAPDPRQLELLRSIGFRSTMIVPLRARGRVIGDLALATAESGRLYDEEDLALAQQLADRCALALDNARLYTELSTSGEEVNTILNGVADAVTAQAPDGRLVYANDAAVRVIGFESVEELLSAAPAEFARRFEMAGEDGGALPLEQLPGRRALMGDRPEPLTVRHRPHGEREWRWARVKATPIFDAAGGVRLAINVIEDITELKRAEYGQRFLAEAGRTLAGSLDYRETLAAVARLAVPDIADWCAVDVLVDGELRRLATAHADPAKVAHVMEIHDRYPPDPTTPAGVFNALRTGRSEVYGEITDEMLTGAARDPAHLELLRSIGMHSVMVVPMALRGPTLGVLTFVSAEAGHTFGEQDLALAESLASRAATAVENARLYEARSAIARTLQASLLPPALPDVRGFELAAAYLAAGEGADVGGDFYDVFGTADDVWYAVIGDVCGKGAGAAAVTAMARYTIRAAAVRRRSPAAILRMLNAAMLRQESPATVGRFCTIAILQLDLSRSPVRATVACGGHPLPAVLCADGSVEEMGAPGTLLGLVDDPDLQDVESELLPGDTVVLYTDGLTEAGAPERVWSPEQLAGVLRGAAGHPPQQVVDHAVQAALGAAPEPRDDIAVVALHARR